MEEIELTDSQKIKLMIIENYIDWLTHSEPKRMVMKIDAFDYVCEDHVDEIEQSRKDSFFV